jgi:hypothetical protein
MAWHHGRYYVRKVKQDGRVRSVYVGGGKVGRDAAAADAARRADRAARRGRVAELLARDAALSEFCAAVEALARAALLAAGYRQHDRGQWRKPRGGTNPTTEETL